MAAVMQSQLDLSEITDYLRGLVWGCWRFRWVAIGVAWALCIAGWALVFLLPDVHRASARVYVDTQSALRPLLQGLAVNTDVLADAGMMTRSLISRPGLERLVDEANLAPSGAFAEREAAITRLQASIKLAWSGNNIVEISYENNDRAKALAVVSSLLNSFIEGSLGENRSDSAAAQRFLGDKLTDYGRRLNEAEAKLAEFKRKNVGLMPDSNVDYFGRLQEATTKLQEIEAQLRVARNRRAELQRQIEGEEPVFGLVPADPKTAAAAETPQDRQIAQFEEQLAELRLKFTDSHPDIVQITKTLEELRAKKEAAGQGSGLRSRSYSPLDLNPVYQQMKLQLSQTDVQIAQLQTEYSDQAAIVGSLRRKVDTVPAIEAEFKSLTRDYDFTKAQYDELLRRVESARMSEDAEKSKDDITFRVIDPPTVPAIPVAPKRGLLMSGVLIFALLGGAGLAFALNLARPVFYTGKELERRFSVPVLGAIRLARGPVEEALARKNTMMALGTVGALVLVYAVLLVTWVAISASDATAATGVVMP